MAEDIQFEEVKKIASRYSAILNQTVDSILDQEVSSYPIIVLSKDTIEIGVRIGSKLNDSWNLNASTLEEFAAKNLIHNERIDEFRKVYKDPVSNYCFFLVEEEEASFIFQPRNWN